MLGLDLTILLLGCCTCVVQAVVDQSSEVFSWRQVDFEFPDERTRRAAIASGDYVQANNLPLGLGVWRDKVFITVPRWKAGVASTLNYVRIESGPKRNRSPALVPYPDYETNRLPAKADGGRRERRNVVSTFRLSVDHACDRLWVIDMGRANGTTYGPPQLHVFDLRSDRVVRRHVVGAELMRPAGGDGRDTWFTALAADSEPGACHRSRAYLADLSGGLVVYDYRRDAARRLEHPYMAYDPTGTEFNVGGVPVQWRDGVFGVAVAGPRRRRRGPGGRKVLYFQPMAGFRMFSVDAADLFRANGTTAAAVFRDHGRRPAGMQAGAVAADPVTGALFYGLVNRDAIGCWNPDRSDRHGPDTTAVPVRDPVRLVYPADVTVDAASAVWTLSDRMPRWRFRVHDFDASDVNYRVFRWPAADLVRGTACEPSRDAGRRPAAADTDGESETDGPASCGD